METSEDAKSKESAEQAYSVTEALTEAKGLLEAHVIHVVGEVSQVSAKTYSSLYFTVKDEKSSLPCRIWMTRFEKLGIQLEVGQLVQMVGRFSIWTDKGSMKFEAFHIALAGEGNLRLQVANLAKKLEAQGLTAAERKRPLPAFPEKIGLVTSPRGAAVHDVLRTLRRRFPVAQVILAGVTVEGQHAAHDMMHAMRAVYDAGAEVILLVRGGGSFEDLMPFNDEKLAITIARCYVPVVTGIGHEVDTTIADMVSDFRASTPTGAAEAVSPSHESLEAYFQARASALANAGRRAVSDRQACVERTAARPLFSDPMYLFADKAQALDFQSMRIGQALPNSLNADRTRIQANALKLRASLAQATRQPQADLDRAAVRLRPVLGHRLDAARQGQKSQQARLARVGETLLVDEARKAEHASQRMRVVGGQMVNRFDNQVARQAARLEDLSPLGVLARGYAIARDARGTVVQSVGEVSRGDEIDVWVSDGTVHCEVRDTRHVETDMESWKES